MLRLPDVADNNCVRSFIVLLFAAVCIGQNVPDPAERIRAAMQASVQAQRASVRIQQERTRGSFFTVPSPSEAPFAREEKAHIDCDPIAEPQLASLINDAAAREQMRPAVVRAVIERESAARPCAVSPKGAQGLMQLMPATAAQFNVLDPFDPKQNVDAGTKFLKQMLSRYGNDLSLALGAYNAGPARVDRDGAVPDIRETQSYVSDILERIKALQTIE